MTTSKRQQRPPHAVAGSRTVCPSPSWICRGAPKPPPPCRPPLAVTACPTCTPALLLSACVAQQQSCQPLTVYQVEPPSCLRPACIDRLCVFRECMVSVRTGGLPCKNILVCTARFLFSSGVCSWAGVRVTFRVTPGPTAAMTPAHSAPRRNFSAVALRANLR